MSMRHVLLAAGVAACLATAPVAAQQAGARLAVPYQMFTLADRPHGDPA